MSTPVPQAALLITVRYHDGRFHGAGGWPPAPARLFQALVNGAATGATLPPPAATALRWLEGLDAPEIRAPQAVKGQARTSYVPNNDLDAVGADPQRVDEVRVGKQVGPVLFDTSDALHYLWRFDATESDLEQAGQVCIVADALYRLGWGLDMAWAQARVLDAADARDVLDGLPGVLHRPGQGDGGQELAVPVPGTLESLERRFQASRGRFSLHRQGRRVQVQVRREPKPRFERRRYGAIGTRLLFDMRAPGSAAPFAPWPLTRAAELVRLVRDQALARLQSGIPELAELAMRVIVGRGARDADKALRVRIVPLPSIGHHHADRGIRRILVEVPPACPLRVDDLAWAFSGVARVDENTGEVAGFVLVASDGREMLQHYGLPDVSAGGRPLGSAGWRHWYSVTPVALPATRARGRVRSGPAPDEAGSTPERLREEGGASTGVLQALRHAGITAQVARVRVQREPFARGDARAEEFAPGSRFAKARLWHVALTFREACAGPLIVGDGRFAGLGLMAPVPEREGIVVLQVAAGLSPDASPATLARALRRALLVRTQALLGPRGTIPRMISGHDEDGSPSRPGRHEHVAIVADVPRSRLLVLAPNILERRPPGRREREAFDLARRALADLVDLRAGRAGRLRLVPSSPVLAGDPLLEPALRWVSATPYRTTRHARRVSAEALLAQDVQRERARFGMPPCSVEIIEACTGVRGGVTGRVRLSFDVPQPGPLLLGRDLHLGGGVFEAARNDD